MFNRKNLNFVLSFLFVALVATVTFAAEGEVPRPDLSEKVKAFMALGAGIGIGIAVLGGGIAQGIAISAGLEGIARNPGAQQKIFIPMLLGLALIESLVILAFVVCFVKLASGI